MDAGLGNTRGFVEILKNAKMLNHGRPTCVVPLSFSLSQPREIEWCGESALYA
jgi:hypothetical protein